MELKIFLLGVACMSVTIILYVVISAFFFYLGLSLVRTNSHVGLAGIMAEFTASVILSFSLSAAIAFLFVGIMGLFGARIPVL